MGFPSPLLGCPLPLDRLSSSSLAGPTESLGRVGLAEEHGGE